VRVLLLDHYYEEFVRGHYAAKPELLAAPFESQAASLAAELFGETQLQVDALRSLGHEALFMPVNVDSMGEAWALERGIRLPRRYSLAMRRWRGLVPRLTRRERWQRRVAVLGAIADSFDPDVVHVQSIEVLPAPAVDVLRKPGRLISAQTASPVVPWRELARYDVLASSLPHYVERIRAEGGAAHYLPLAFEPTLASVLGAATRQTPVSFVGSLTPHHQQRIRLLSAISRRVAIDIWSSDPPTSAFDGAPVRFHGPAWGRDMYRVLGTSRVTINVHGEHAAGYANNLRLYEATGMGALLVTEAAPNLASLFEPGVEVATYRDENELAEVVAHYADHEEEAAATAARGQARTHREHTWGRRMGELVAIFEAHRRPRGHERGSHPITRSPTS
jgi:spore maturation protein CgeB